MLSLSVSIYVFLLHACILCGVFLCAAPAIRREHDKSSQQSAITATQIFALALATATNQFVHACETCFAFTTAINYGSCWAKWALMLSASSACVRDTDIFWCNITPQRLQGFQTFCFGVWYWGGHVFVYVSDMWYIIYVTCCFFY